MKFALLFLLSSAIPLFSLAQPTDAERQIIPPLMGWSSWNTYRVNISDELIKKQADALVQTGLKEAGYTYINIDDGFFGKRDSTGRKPPAMKPKPPTCPASTTWANLPSAWHTCPWRKPREA